MRLGSSRVLVACAVALAIGEGGCAMIMQQAPKANRAPGEAPVCSSGRGGVALDVIMTTLLGAGALVALANDEPGAGLAIGAVGGAYAYSAMSGHRSAAACEEARDQYELEIAARRPQQPLPRQPGSAPPATAASEPVLRRPTEEAAAAEPEGPPVEQPVAAPGPPAPGPPAAGPPAAGPPAAEPAPAIAPAPRDWSDFWIEVTR